MKCFSTSIIIQASPETIWNILIDAAKWEQWNPTITKIEGNIALGETVKVYAKITPNRAFSVKVSELIPNERMIWTSGMPFGLFKGERTYNLSRQGDGSVEFAMQEVFSGLILPLIAKSIPNLQPAFNEFSEALKKQAEETT
jgi:hypothetical protein